MQFKIYRLISPSGKSYIGYTSKTIEWRWKTHKQTWLRQYENSERYNCPKLFKAFEKYNPYTPNLWTYEYIFFTDNKNYAAVAEELLILEFNTLNDGYNSHPGGKFSNGLKGRKQTPNHIAKRFAKPRLLSLETKKQQSISRLQMFETEEGKKLKQHLSQLAKQNTNRKGIACSDSAKAKISAANSRSYKLKYPDETIHIVNNLTQFCRDNNLTLGILLDTRPGRKWKQHKGYSILESL